MNTINLANLSLGIGVDFLIWVIEHRIGNWESLFRLIAVNSKWYEQEYIPFECSDKEATLISLKWA